MKTLISAVLLLASCVSALADRQADLVAAWSKQVHSVIKRTACYPQGDAGQRSGSDRVQRRARWARPRSSRPGVVRLGHPRRGGTLTIVRNGVSGTAECASRRPLQLPTPDTLRSASKKSVRFARPTRSISTRMRTRRMLANSAASSSSSRT
jgi:hypothetical protein